MCLLCSEAHCLVRRVSLRLGQCCSSLEVGQGVCEHRRPVMLFKSCLSGGGEATTLISTLKCAVPHGFSDAPIHCHDVN